jgi:hypothetical protein
MWRLAQSASTKLVTRAARAALGPRGLTQRGRSRSWLDDHGWWVVVVEFESFAFEQGSGLAVFADFLWHDRDHLAHSVGGRVGREGRVLEQHGGDLAYPFEDEQRFERRAHELAARAAAEIDAWRLAFPDLASWSAHLSDTADGEGLWRQFDAGICAALVGQRNAAIHWLGRAAQSSSASDAPGWEAAAHRDARHLTALLADDEARFREEVERRARRTRARLHLPAQALSV